MLYSWNHTVCSLFRLVSSTEQCAFKVLPCPFITYSSFVFIVLNAIFPARNYSTYNSSGPLCPEDAERWTGHSSYSQAPYCRALEERYGDTENNILQVL